MSFQDKLYELINGLTVATGKGLIKWSETADEDAFRAVLNSGLVRVGRVAAYQNGVRESVISKMNNPGLMTHGQASPLDDFEYYLLILDDRNKEISRFVPDRPERALTLQNLWEVARRSALNSEQKIDSILQEVANRVGLK